MKRTNEDWSVKKLDEQRTRISFPEYQREKSLWTEEKKSLLIDSILRDIDIPKLYFNLLKDKNIEVIDGQQRLWSVWEFLDDEYPYQGDGKWRKFSKLTAGEKQKIRNYKFQVTVFEEAEEDYLRMLFVRLQLGLLLITGEKLNAARGKMKQFVFKKLVGDQKLVGHPFIRHIGIPVKRFSKQTLCAQICINSFTRNKLGVFSRTRYADLIHFFNEYADPKGKDLELFNTQSKNISDVLDQLQECFGDHAKNLKNRSYILSIYLFVEELISQEREFSAKEQELFSNFVFQLWTRLREESRLSIDKTNRELYSFQTLLSSAPGEEYQIDRRHRKLSEYYEHFKKTGKIRSDR